MKVCEWYFGFHQGARLKDVLTGHQSHTALLGHVEAWGYTIDGTWIFFDPRGRNTEIQITHIYEEVLDYGQERFERCESIFLIEARENRISSPILRPHLNCVTQCAALLGWRAYSLAGFQKMLLKNGAKIEHGHARRRPSSASRASTCA